MPETYVCMLNNGKRSVSIHFLINTSILKLYIVLEIYAHLCQRALAIKEDGPQKLVSDLFLALFSTKYIVAGHPA